MCPHLLGQNVARQFNPKVMVISEDDVQCFSILCHAAGITDGRRHYMCPRLAQFRKTPFPAQGASWKLCCLAPEAVGKLPGAAALPFAGLQAGCRQCAGLGDRVQSTPSGAGRLRQRGQCGCSAEAPMLEGSASRQRPASRRHRPRLEQHAHQHAMLLRGLHKLLTASALLQLQIACALTPTAARSHHCVLAIEFDHGERYRTRRIKAVQQFKIAANKAEGIAFYSLWNIGYESEIHNEQL